ncbi:methyltransferase family protein [Helicobacter sp. 23-1044]
MQLKDRLKNEGDFLFRWRSYLPLVLVPFIVAVIFCFELPLFDGKSYNNALIIFALFVGLAGQIWRIFVVGYAPKDTSGRNTKEQKAEVLNTSGLYATCRNPLYFGNFLMMLSPVLMLGNWIFALLFCLAFWLYYERIIYAEEAFLSKKFGEAYQKWCDSTPCFLPNLARYSKNSLPFSLKSTLRREYNSLFGLASSLFATNILFCAIKNLQIGGGGQIIMPSAIISAFFALCLVIFIIVRFLVKKTSILSVENR